VATERDTLLNWRPLPPALVGAADSGYRGGRTRQFTPSKSALSTAGVELILQGWAPRQPIIDSTTRITAHGSCFAAEFTLWLGDNGFNRHGSESPYARQIPTFENVWTTAQQFRWAFGGLDSANIVWIDAEKRVYPATEEHRQAFVERLSSTDVLIMTLGLSEVWYDRVTDEPLLRRLPKEFFDAERHALKVLTAAETSHHLQQIEAIRAAYLPNLRIVYTVSPVRLAATFRPIGALSANDVSKATLRAGLDEFLRSREDLLGCTYFYFPAYEIARDFFRDPYAPDNRHIRPSVVSQILDVFARYYTSLPVTGAPAFDPEDETRLHVAELAAEVMSLQTVCDERAVVIEELASAAAARLEGMQALQRAVDEGLAVNRQLRQVAADRLDGLCAIQRVAEQRLALIMELNRTADERLALIERLQEIAEERLALIVELKRTADERLALIERLQEIAEERLELVREPTDHQPA
jgi:hypothetical protein